MNLLFIRWKTSSTEEARIVSEFQGSLYDRDAFSSAAKHHKYNEKIKTEIQQRCRICLSSNSIFHVIPLKWFL